MPPQITTIITTYQRPLLLKRAVNSILNQTYSQFRLCVYDNASNDETEALMRMFAEKDPRIIYHRHSENIGMMENYKFAFDRIETPFFHFLSDDDYLMPFFFETSMQNFSECPDAAFSACGILQLNESGHFISDPLSSWKREGFYAAPAGMLQMIRKHMKFPVPTGIIFQHKCVKDIKPDFSEEIQIYWDPDYLLRIASKHPIVINKKPCGVFLVHDNSFCYSIYSSIIHNPRNVELYLKATSLILRKIKKNAALSFINKIKAKLFFRRNVTVDTINFTKSHIQTSKYSGVHFTFRTFYKYFGCSYRVIFYHGLAAILKCFSFLYVCPNKLLKFSLRRKSHKNHALSFEDTQKYHNYGQSLLNDILH